MKKLLLMLVVLFTSLAWAQLASYQGPQSYVGKQLVDMFVAGTGLTDFTCKKQPYGTTCNLKGTGETNDLEQFGRHLLRFVNKTRETHPEFGLLGFAREPKPAEKRITYVLKFNRTQPVKRISVRLKYGRQNGYFIAFPKEKVYVSITAVAWPNP